MAADRVSAASLELRGGRPVIAAYATEPLPDGALVPSLTTANIHNRAAVAGALGHVFDRIGGRPRRVGLVIPDPVAKVSLVRFEHVPARQQDLDGLIRWQVKKASPFAIDDAQVGYTAGQRAIDGQEFIVTVAKRDIVHEHEELCGEVGAHAGLVRPGNLQCHQRDPGRALVGSCDRLVDRERDGRLRFYRDPEGRRPDLFSQSRF